MKILYNLGDKTMWVTVPTSQPEHARFILYALGEEIKGRLSPLKYLIDEEELNNKLCALVLTLSNEGEIDFGILNYSDDLTTKVAESVSMKDISFWLSRLEQEGYSL